MKEEIEGSQCKKKGKQNKTKETSKGIGEWN